MARVKREKDVEQMLVDACKEYDFLCLKTEKVARGFPDRMIICNNGFIIFVELKNNTSYGMMEQQKEWRHLITSKGIQHFVIDGEIAMKDFIQFLELYV